MKSGSGFGATTSTTPFGQSSTFGKPASSFTTPVFGSTGSSLFGQTTQPQTSSLFGNTASAPAFGQTQTTQPSFGGFPATGTTSLFGNQQNAAGTSSSIFGSSGTSAFGQAKPTFSGFTGQTGTTSLFGQQPQAQGSNTQTPSLFGQTAAPASTGLFGSSTGAFGSTAGGGTTVKFTPVTGTDTMVKNGVTQTISTRHHCITCMKEYESKSLEELRLEDYAANRKGPQQGVQATGGLFGSTPQPSLFGSPTTTNQLSTATSGSIFGGFNPSGGFGSSGGLFGKTGTTSTAFGSTTNTANQPSFGFNPSSTTAPNPFGANTGQQKPFGVVSAQPSTGLFGSTSQPSNVFGSATSSGFGSGFGSQPNQLFVFTAKPDAKLLAQLKRTNRLHMLKQKGRNYSAYLKVKDDYSISMNSEKLSSLIPVIINDEYDAIGMIWALKLRKLNDNQRILAEHLINRILTKGFFNELHKSTDLLVRPLKVNKNIESGDNKGPSPHLS